MMMNMKTGEIDFEFFGLFCITFVGAIAAEREPARQQQQQHDAPLHTQIECDGRVGVGKKRKFLFFLIDRAMCVAKRKKKQVRS